MPVEIENNASIILHEKNFEKFSSFKRHHEPVECSDSDGNDNECEQNEEEKNSDGDVNTDSLSNLLEKCDISEKCSEKQKGEDEEVDICAKLSHVSLKEKILNDNGSIEVVVESIKKEDECEDNKTEENASTLSARGPDGGIPTGFKQSVHNNGSLFTNQNNFGDQTANIPYNLPYTMNYPSHKMYNTSNHNDIFQTHMMGGKRRPEEDDVVPFKFHAPGSNNIPLNIPPEEHTNHGHMCGGVMSVQSGMPDFPDPQEFDGILDYIPVHVEEAGHMLSHPKTDYGTDTQSEGYNSPDHESQYSPMGIDSPPPSNMSEDSGIAGSPSSPYSRHNDVVSPKGMSIDQPAVSPQGQRYTPPSSEPTIFNVQESSNQENGQFWSEDKVEDLHDLLNVIADDMKQDKQKKASKKGVNDLVCTTAPLKQNTIKIGQSANKIKKHQTISAVPKHPVPITNNKTVIAPAINTTPIAVTFAPQSIPVTTSQFFVISQSAQPVFVVNHAPKNTPKITPKQTTFKPIRPKLGPLPPTNPSSSTPSKTTETKCKLPVTATAAARETATSIRPVNSIQPASKTPTSATNKITGSPPPSRKLNLARRLVANMTSRDLRFQDNEGDTYLHVAACKADTNFVQALLERLEREQLTGMVHVPNTLRQTSLYCAVGANNPDMVKILIKYGADVNDQAERITQDGMPREVNAAIHVAASNGKEYSDTLKVLLGSRDLKIDKPNSEGQTALHCAILCHDKPKKNTTQKIDSTPIIEALIEHNADINAQDMKSGKTPFMYALESKSLHLISLVSKHIRPENVRAYIRVESFDGNTPWKILENLKTTMDADTWKKVYDMAMCVKKRW